MKLQFNLQRILDSYDNYLNDKKESEKAILIYSPAVLIVFLAYFYLFPIVDSYYTKIKKQHNALQTEMQNLNNIILTQSSGDILAKLKKDADDAKANTEIIWQQKSLIEEKIYDLSLNQEKWHTLLDQITKEGDALGIKLDTFTFKDNNVVSNNIKSTIITVEGDGNYKNILLFLNFLESKSGYVNLKNIQMQGGGEIVFKVEIEVWRMDV